MLIVLSLNLSAEADSGFALSNTFTLDTRDITIITAITAVSPIAADGSGKVQIVSTSTSTLAAASSGNEIKFRFTADGLMDSGAISLTVPQGWSPPQGISGKAGYTIAIPASLGASIDIPTFSGSTVTVPIISLSQDQSVDIIYGNGRGDSGAATPDIVNTSINFIVKSMGKKGGELLPVSLQPTVLLTYASDGSGTLTLEIKKLDEKKELKLSPIIAGSSGYELTFTYTAYGLIKDGMFSITLPVGWSPPQSSGGTAGQLNVSAIGGGSVSQANISGQNISIPIARLSGGQSIKVIYGIGGTAKAQDEVGTIDFQAKSQGSTSGSLTPLAKGNQPAISALCAPDGSGKVQVKVISQPFKATAGSKRNQISFEYTPIGTMADGEVSIEIPVSEGWTSPQAQSNLPGAVSVSSTGLVGSVGVVGNAIRVPIKSLKSNQSLTVQYGNVGVLGASAPLISTSSKFEVKVKGCSSGSLLPIIESDQPIIKVENAEDGSGEVSFSSNPAAIHSGQSGIEMVFIYKAIGTMNGGAVSLSFPAGWSQPQGEVGKAGYTVATSTGEIGALKFITSASTVKVAIIKLGAGDTITITYGFGGKESGGKAPSAVGTSPLTLKSQGSSSGSLQPVIGQLSVTLDPKPPNTSPTITQIGNQAIVPNQPIIFEVNEGGEISFNILAKDKDNDPIIYKAENLPKGSGFNSATAKFSWKLGYDIISASEKTKDFLIKFSAIDGVDEKLSDIKEVVIRVSYISIAADLTIESSSASLIADGTSTSKVIIKVLDSEKNPVADEVVSLKASLGKVSSVAINNNDGTYTAEYTSATSTGNATITATTSNNKSKDVTIILSLLDTVAEISSVDVKGSPAKAESKISVILKAEVGGSAKFSIEGLTRAAGISMKETSSGIYEGEYIVAKGEDVKDAKVKVNFEDKSGNLSEDSSQRATIDTTPPPKPTELKVAGDSINIGNVTSVEVAGKATPNVSLKASISDGVNVIEKAMVADSAGSFKFTFDASSLKDGVITVSIFEDADIAGNLGEKAQLSVVKDTKPSVVKDTKPTEKVDFLLSSFSTFQSVEADKPSVFIITIFGQGGFNLPVTLTVDGLPEGVSGTFSPKVLTPSAKSPKQDSQLTIKGLEKISEGEYQFSVLAFASGIASKSISLNLKKEKLSAAIILLLSDSKVKLEEKLKVQGQIISPANTPKPQGKAQISLTYSPPEGKPTERVVQTNEELIYQDGIEVDVLGKWSISVKWEGDNIYKSAQKTDVFEGVKGESQIQLQLRPAEAVKLGDVRKIEGLLKSLVKGEALKNENAQVNIIKPLGTKIVQKVNANEFGAFEFDFKFDIEGSWQIEASWDGNQSYLSAKSKTLAVPVVKENAKAIIVLGGGSESENPAWNQFAGLANYIYKTLKRRDLTDDDIYYLSPTEKLLASVDSKTSKEALKFAITDWAKKRTSKDVPLFIYLLSHNLNDKFLLEKLKEREAILTPEDLAGWLDALDKDVEATLIIEACFSGNFIAKKLPTGEPVLSRSNRVIITSAKEDKQALILRDLSSFSKAFFNQIVRNESINMAFLKGRDSIRALRSLQSPQIDANGDGRPNDPTRDFPAVEKKYIPEFRLYLASVPEIKEVVSKPAELKSGVKSATIEVKILGTDITAVFANVVPPNFDPNKTFTDWNDLNLNFDQIKFQRISEGVYKGEYDNFVIPGEYSLVVQAENPDGSAVPAETIVKVLSPSWDVNSDGEVNIFDIVIVAKNIGISTKEGDVNLDGKVDIFDLVLVANHFGERTTGASPNREIAQTDSSQYLPILEKVYQLLQSSSDPSPEFESARKLLEQLIALSKPVVKETKLLPNYPNPFNPETWIPYQLNKASEVTITIYDVLGRMVKRLDLGYQQAGMYRTKSRAAYWDGHNEAGEPVASGVYFVELKTKDYNQVRRIVMIK